jgi:adenylate kinase family enzyme
MPILLTVSDCRLVLSFDCPFDVLESRLEERAKTSDRADDNPETMRKRFDTFQEQSKPVIEHYTKQGRCRHISAEDGPEKIFEEVCAVLDKELCG